MSDLLKKLRKCDGDEVIYEVSGRLLQECADRIEALEGEINGTDHLAGDPTKWGLRAILEGACQQRDDALKRIEALEQRCNDDIDAWDDADKHTAMLVDRIEALEAALREIANGGCGNLECVAASRRASRALEGKHE